MACLVLLGLAGLTNGCGGTKPEAADPTTYTGDLAAAQGTWIIVKAEVPEGTPTPPAEELEPYRGVIKGNLLTIIRRVGDEDRKEYVEFTLDESQSPKRFDLIEPEEKPKSEPKSVAATVRKVQEPEPPQPRERFAGIYKFEGDHLIVAWRAVPFGPPPSEFKPVARKPTEENHHRGGIEVYVVHLKKKP
jgi:uncharacterized protein (TIGR03067 family)